MGLFRRKKQKEQEPLEARLEVGESVLLENNVLYDLLLFYCGMPSEESYSLMTTKINFYSSSNIPFCCPVSKKAIDLQGMHLEILEVNPDYIQLKYQHHKE